MGDLVSLDDLRAARERVAKVKRATPVDRSDSLTKLVGRPVYLKPEYLQRTGSFKIRGAYNRISRLPPGQPVVAASAGNHAQGVALAASLTGRHSTIYMPVSSPLPKIEATKAYGATVRLAGDSVDDAIAIAKATCETGEAVFVPPFDDLLIIAGQGSVGLEVADEVPDVETVLVPVGGGGLIAGIAAALAHTRPGTKVIGVQAAGCASMRDALEAGCVVTVRRPATMADGIAVKSVSELTLAHARAYVHDVLTVTEEEISSALVLLLERAKAVVEPAGAAALAALLAGKVPGAGPTVAVLSGGNIDPLLLTKVIAHGLSAAGRYVVLRVVVEDRPGMLASLTAEVAKMGLNVLSVEHHRSGLGLGLAEVEIQLTVETRNAMHTDEIVADLEAAGFDAQVVR
jgi:threonine dehydratase